MTEKEILRRQMREQFRSLSLDEKQQMDAALFQNLLQIPQLTAADTVLLYCSMPEEPDTRQLLHWLLEKQKQTALPVCTAHGEMHFFLLHHAQELQPGAYGIPEPSGRVQPELTAQSVCLVPGLAFSRDGKRLGKGGGYYDRFLQANPLLLTIGITYGRFLQETIPCEAHDCKVQMVVTDQSWRLL